LSWGFRGVCGEQVGVELKMILLVDKEEVKQKAKQTT